MPRARNVKPGFFKNELLAECDPLTRLLFVGIWCVADREGRLELRPRRLKAELMPYDEINVEDSVADLVDRGFLHVYEAEGVEYLQVINWGKHQNPHHKEVCSVIPAPAGHVDRVCKGYVPLSNTIRRRIYARDGRVCAICGATHGLSIDHILPVSRGGNTTDDNLRVLCLSCNSRKGNSICMDKSSMTHTRLMDKSSESPVAPLIPDSPSLIPDSGIQRKADASPAAPPLRGSRLKPTWTPALNTEEWVAHNFPAVDYAGQLDAFRDYWTAKPGKDGCKLDWDATFRNWIRNSRQTTRAGPTAKPKTVAAYDAIGAKIDELSTVVPGRDRARIAGPDPAKP